MKKWEGERFGGWRVAFDSDLHTIHPAWSINAEIVPLPMIDRFKLEGNPVVILGECQKGARKSPSPAPLVLTCDESGYCLWRSISDYRSALFSQKEWTNLLHRLRRWRDAKPKSFKFWQLPQARCCAWVRF